MSEYTLTCENPKSKNCVGSIKVETSAVPRGFTNLWLMEAFNKRLPKESQWRSPTSCHQAYIICPACSKEFRWPPIPASR